MNKKQETKEKNCMFYVSDYHFEMISYKLQNRRKQKNNNINRRKFK